MGSGETAPTMVTPHRDIVARLGDAPPRAVLLDTPYGFQENAAEITQQAPSTTSRSACSSPIDVAGFPGPLAADPAQRTGRGRARRRWRACAPPTSSSPARAARPTRSPTGAARRCPRRSPTQLARGGGAGVRQRGGAHARAASPARVRDLQGRRSPSIGWTGSTCCAGSASGPLRRDPALRQRRGRQHDTRFCYMGERRLSLMEAMLPDDAWLLGIDEHTALTVDLDAKEVAITGRGGVTVRRRGVREVFAAGADAAGRARPRCERRAWRAGAETAGAAARACRRGAGRRTGGRRGRGGRMPRVRGPAQEGAVAAARRGGSARAGVRRGAAGPERWRRDRGDPHLDRTILDWAADSLQSDEPDRARAMLHSLVHRLGEAASVGLRDPRERRRTARRAPHRPSRRAPRRKAWQLADRVRDRLEGGIEIRDTPDGTEWDLRE